MGKAIITFSNEDKSKEAILTIDEDAQDDQILVQFNPPIKNQDETQRDFYLIVLAQFLEAIKG